MPAQPQARLPHGGRLRGVPAGDPPVEAYLGLPYARPPARFRAPQPVPAWTGVRTAETAGPLAPQTPSRLEPVLGPQATQPQSEDCLRLHVWTPAADSGRRPVLVFLHGGAFLTGGGGLDWYDGARLAARGDLVVVGVSYRLGVLGFGAVPTLADGLVGNAGLRDIRAALHWVRDSIGAFGGAPDRITVSGQSAGAYAILGLLGGPEPPPFAAAILQSAPGGMAPATAPEALRTSDRVRTELAAGTGLADVAVPDLLAAQSRVNRWWAAGHPDGVAPAFLPVGDGELMPADPVAAAGRSGGGGVRLLLGSTRTEGSAFFDSAEVARSATERFFDRPVRQLAGALAAAGRPAWVYRFDWCPPASRWGATHCLELPFQFGVDPAWTAAPMLAGADPAELAALTELVQGAWIAFCHGRPPRSDWPQWTVAAPGRMHLDTTPQWRPAR